MQVESNEVGVSEEKEETKESADCDRPTPVKASTGESVTELARIEVVLPAILERLKKGSTACQGSKGGRCGGPITLVGLGSDEERAAGG